MADSPVDEGSETMSDQPVAIVTGSGRGIGKATAIELARRGYGVTLAARTVEQLRETHAQIAGAGGSGLVVIKTGFDAIEAGVDFGGVTFRGFPVKGTQPGLWRSLIAWPLGAKDTGGLLVWAEDRAGNRGVVRFTFRPRRARYRTEVVKLSAKSLAIISQRFRAIHPSLSGSALDVFLAINRGFRRRDNERIRHLCLSWLSKNRRAASKAMWRGAFLRLPRSKRMAPFGEIRVYEFEDKAIDRQRHLGVDLASVRRAGVPAANDGMVVYVGYLGIYGQTVVLAHGLGLFTLYSHLSRAVVEPGKLVRRGELLGQTGMTGLALGDHLHFGVLVGGVFVEPREWWDKSWLEKNLDAIYTQAGLALPGIPAKADKSGKK